MLSSSLRLHLSGVALGLAACGGSCDAPFRISNSDAQIIPTHAFVREDGAA